jgi:predicted RNase H-like nuclease
VAIQRFIGVDLAWAPSRPGRGANESGVAVLDPDGRVLDAGWTRTLHETIDWINTWAGTGSALLFIDAPLIVDNPTGQRACETQVGQRYGAWKVSANSTNLRSPRLAGVDLRVRLQAAGWTYDDGHAGPPTRGRAMSECYPYTTLVGAPELGYDHERPAYKRKPASLAMTAWRPIRADACDELISRLDRLSDADPALRLDPHPLTRWLVGQPSPINDAAYKHREDLIDALLCAWTAALWYRHGLTRCQVLGPATVAGDDPVATIIAPTRPNQRSPRPLDVHDRRSAAAAAEPAKGAW